VKGLLRPVGSEPARVYWVRRLVVLAVAVIVLVAAGFFISRVFGSSDESDPKPAVTPTDTEDAAPAPDEPCQPEDISLALNTAPEKIDAGKDAAFDVAVTNNGKNACTIDLGDKSRVLTITSGNDGIWSSADCPAKDDESRLVLLRPGSANVNTVIWDGARSNAECATDLPKPRPGTYKLKVEMKDVDPVEHRFDIS